MFPWVRGYTKEKFLGTRNHLIKNPLQEGYVAEGWLIESIMCHTRWGEFERSHPQAGFLVSVSNVYGRCERRVPLTQDDINTINALFGAVKIRSLDEYM